MIACKDRLKMAVLYFLASMMKTHSKSPEVIEPFLLHIVDNLEECKKFPWGRYTFEDSLHELEPMFERFKGEVRKSWTFPGFIILLELLAYEAIPSLKMEYRKEVPAGKDCPRMCKRKFMSNGMSGYPLEDLHKAFVDSKDICSILEASLDEEIYLMSRIWDQDFCGDNEDGVADGIMAHLSAGKKIFWEELYNQDVAARAEEKTVHKEKSGPHEADPLTSSQFATPSPGEMWEMMKTLMKNGFKSMMSLQEMVEVKLGDIIVWLGNLEDEVKTLKKNNKGKKKVEKDEDGVDDESEYHSASLQREHEYFGFGKGTSGGRREDENFGFAEGTSAGRHEDVVGEAAHPSPVAAAHPSPVAASDSSPVPASQTSMVPCSGKRSLSSFYGIKETED